ncbi:MAG TPA: SUMF1/EgtB/PvdO family nonheme iron enzyme [Treponema sp.]|nr:SUMF1/EgtB/PvdO family nonheme iron enzyme [Treponema sp.]
MNKKSTFSTLRMLLYSALVLALVASCSNFLDFQEDIGNIKKTATYTITYNLNGGTQNPANPANYTVETSTITLATPTRTGYAFGGWYANVGLTGTPVTSILIGSFGTKMFWAKWTLADYTSIKIGTMRYVPAGSFQRDSTATNISIVKAFRMSECQITRAQFLDIMGTDPSNTIYSSGTTDPVQTVNWYRAIAFCNKLSIEEGLQPVYSVTDIDFSTLNYASIPTTDNATWNAASADWNKNGYRLPTEMEWMWAAMGATSDRTNGNTGVGVNTTGYSKAFAGSTGSNAIGDYAWSSTNSSSKTHPVGTKTANELVLRDMSGNVWEWCWDWYGSYPSGTLESDTPAGRGAVSGVYRLLRGGVWGMQSEPA